MENYALRSKVAGMREKTMNVKDMCAKTMAVVMLGGAFAAPLSVPTSANAQRSFEQELKRRQQKKNEWRNIGIGSGALGLYGLLTKNNTLMWAGVAGGLYSANRYEQDRKSQSKMERDRASFYSKPTTYRNGKRYVRRTVWKNGQKYYKFVRG